MKTSSAVNLMGVFDKLVTEVMRYESDTFSATDEKITRKEAQLVVLSLIADRIQIGENVDGVSLSGTLEEVREQ